MTDIVSRLLKDGGNFAESNKQRELDAEAARTIVRLRENVEELLEQRNAAVQARTTEPA